MKKLLAAVVALATTASLPSLVEAAVRTVTWTANGRPKWLLVCLQVVIGTGALASEALAQCISLNAVDSPYYQDFNTLVSSGTSSATPPGWTFFEGGANGDGMYTAGDGSSNVGDTYSFGSSGSSDRAFGTLHGNSVVPRVGACFLNNTGSGIQRLEIFYVGEQWRRGNSNLTDQLEFEYSPNATDLQSGVWTRVSALDFNSPNNDPMPTALDGNAAANRAVRSAAISNTGIPHGTTFWIRWTDPNAQNGDDDGLAVDDFVLTVGTATSVPHASPPVRMAVYPNPSPASFSITYRLLGIGPAEVAIFDLSGRLVRVLSSGIRGEGEQTLHWDADDAVGHRLAPGTYFARLEEAGRVERVKIAIVR